MFDVGLCQKFYDHLDGMRWYNLWAIFLSYMYGCAIKVEAMLPSYTNILCILDTYILCVCKGLYKPPIRCNGSLNFSAFSTYECNYMRLKG